MRILMDFPARAMAGSVINSSIVFIPRGIEVFARGKVKPGQPETEDQVKIRAYLSAASKNWALITESQRKAWNAWTETYLDGPSSNPSGNLRQGIDAYILANSVRQILGLSLTADAPTSGLPTPATGLTMATSSTDDQVDFWISHAIASGSVANFKILAKQTPIMKTAAQTPKSAMARLIEHVSSDSSLTLAATGISHPYNFASPQFPPVAADQYGLSVQIVETATGLASKAFFASVVQSAT